MSLTVLAVALQLFAPTPDTIGQPVTNPCGAQEVGQVGLDSAWINSQLVDAGFSRDLVCRPDWSSVDAMAKHYAYLPRAQADRERDFLLLQLWLNYQVEARAIHKIRKIMDQRYEGEWTAEDERIVLADARKYKEEADEERASRGDYSKLDVD